MRLGAAMPAVMQPGFPAVQRLNPLELRHWNDRLPACRERSFFHRAEWARVLQEAYGYSPCYFVCQRSDGADQVLPLMEVDSRVTGRRGVGLPFTDFCPPLVSEPGGFQALLEQALAYGAARGWKYLEVRGGREWTSSAPPSESYYVHELCLQADARQVATGFKDSVRRAIRRGEKLSVTVAVEAGVGAVREFYRLQCQTRRRHGLPPQPLQFFLKVHEHILSPGHGLLVLARHGGRAVAGAMFFHFDDQALFKYGASDAALQALRANDLVMWEAIKQYALRGLRRLNLGRTSLANAGLRRFKLAWGAQEQLLEYRRYDFNQRAFVAGRDAASGWYNRVFRRLPLALSRWIGAVAYRHVA